MLRKNISWNFITGLWSFFLLSLDTNNQAIIYSKQNVNANSPGAHPVTSFPSRRNTPFRAHHIIATIIIFHGTTSMAICSASIVVSSTVHGSTIPVPGQNFCPVVVGWYIRATVLGIPAALACFSLFKILVLACCTHPISSCPAHFDPDNYFTKQKRENENQTIFHPTSS